MTLKLSDIIPVYSSIDCIRSLEEDIVTWLDNYELRDDIRVDHICFFDNEAILVHTYKVRLVQYQPVKYDCRLEFLTAHSCNSELGELILTRTDKLENLYLNPPTQTSQNQPL